MDRIARSSLALVALTCLPLAACGGAPAAEEPPPPPSDGAGDDAPPADVPPPADETPPAPTPPPVPTLTASDPHTRVLGAVDASCTIRGVEDGAVYVSSYRAAPAGRGSALVRFALDAPALAAPTLVHEAPELLEYRVGHGHVATVENAVGFGTSTIRVLPITGGEVVEVARQIRQSTWLVGPDGVYWGDPSYTEPHIQRVGWTGGEPVTVEELRPVFDEDRLEQLILSEGELVFVAVRTRMSQGGGYFCHELRGGPPGQSRTLRRYRRCPSDEELLSAVSASAAHVYYFRDTGFFRVSRAGGRGAVREETVLLDTGSVPSASATDGTFLVWSESGGVMRLAVGASPVGRVTPERIGERARTVGAPWISGGNVYWTRQDEGAPCVLLSRPIDAPALPAGS